jgi:hypothetical protein
MRSLDDVAETVEFGFRVRTDTVAELARGIWRWQVGHRWDPTEAPRVESGERGRTERQAAQARSSRGAPPAGHRLEPGPVGAGVGCGFTAASLRARRLHDTIG